MDKIIKYATKKHEGQKRKNSRADDYIVHPLEVKDILLNNGVIDYNTLAAAVLHDTIEDTDATYLEIKEKFGQDIADIVLEVTDDKSLPKKVRKELQASKIAGKSFSARMIKIADKLSKDILTDPPKHWTELDKNGYIMWSYTVCKNAMAVGDTPKKLSDLVQKQFEALGLFEYPDSLLNEYYDNL